MPRRIWRKISYAAAVAILAALVTQIFEHLSAPPPALSTFIRPDRSGDEIVAVFLVTRNCPAAQSGEFRSALSEALSSVREAARVKGVRSHFVGVMLSPNTAANRKFIVELAAFDEIHVGPGWLGFGAITYFWRDLPGLASVPQLVLLRRRIEVGAEGISVSPDSILFRLDDADAISRWAQAGAPIEL